MARYSFESCRGSSSGLLAYKREARAFRSRSVRFNDPEVPTGPSQNILDQNMTDTIVRTINLLLTIFEERPIWSRVSLLVKTRIHEWILREALLHVAYTFQDGPWARAWIRFGFDPRSTPKAKHYQIVNYRTTFPESVAPKQIIPVHYRSRRPDTYSLINVKENSPEFYSELRYKFKANELPPTNSLFYLLIDIDLDSVQKIVHANDGMEPETCDREDGFCVINYQAKCRAAMQIAHKRLIQQFMSKT
ncbi:hypothetical protein ACOME3_008698 [Neoechinorhynchus agilis]